ncbi:helix-turn-helix domain-containing protein [Pseudomonas sp. L-22-4S-12]|uniref:helix-turn-helix domain-containing protein n=1 Tax=Pseudomonas sp. L-22-4S-12 TaxID=2610893 RepID=UPI0013265A0A|nr:AraC family transcriptional regulator [Pseudomonas sp. L-22-4S-12]MWV18231.1 helix-turn-helix domain-containing protein [Pseudomonas sp. L-22-4S-12]
MGSYDSTQRQADYGFTDEQELLECWTTSTCSEKPTDTGQALVRLAPWQERRAKALIAANLGFSLTMTHLARECSLSRSHFSRAFHGSFGMSPHQWLTQQRIIHAQRLLQSERTITAIAQDCGFADQAHFSRVFTRLVGLPPSLWRLGLPGEQRA